MSNVGTRTVCKKDMCAGCMACVDSCRHGAIAIEDTIEAYNARIDPTRCVGCGLCEKTCPQMVSPSSLRPLEWLQGWAKDTSLRMSSSSGGLATAISEAFVASNGLVCSCAQEGGEFRFHLTSDADYLRRAQGSKYVKSNPLGAYREVREALQGGQRVLFIGLPCQVAAMRNFVGSRLADSLYTIDLICHGSPSPKVLSRFLEETGNNLSNELILDFRKKVQFQLRYRGAETVGRTGVRDRYSIAFLSGLPYTEGCYSCRYAKGDRVSDITLGDSWGSELSDEVANGISLALVQTDKGRELLEMTDLELLPVDPGLAVANNEQLQRPSTKPIERNDKVIHMLSNSKVPKCVVLMASYNGIPFISEQIDSILSQTEVDVRLFVRDDGSSDGTRDLLQRYADEGSLTLLTGENLGPALGFLTLLRNAPEADYYAFSDQDDIWDSDKLITAIKQLKKQENLALYHCNSRLVDSAGNEMGRLTYGQQRCISYRDNDPLNQLCIESPMGCTQVFDRRIWEVVCLHELPHPVIMHDKLIANLCVLLGYRIVFDASPHMGYRQHGRNVVGVSTDLPSKVIERINSFCHPREITLAKQVTGLLSTYSDCILPPERALGELVSKMDASFMARCRVSFSSRLNFGSLQKGLFNRSLLLFGKR